MKIKPITISELGDFLEFNSEPDGGARTVAALRLHRCIEVECSPSGLFFTYPDEAMSIAHAKADLDVLTGVISEGVYLKLVLTEEGGATWLTAILPSTFHVDEVRKARTSRLLFHLRGMAS